MDGVFTVLLGDAAGVDRLVQSYFSGIQYPNVQIYAGNGKARNNVGNWPVHNVEVQENIKGFDFYIQKDIQMARDADNGFMIWNGKSKGTLNNIINLTSQNKPVKIYLIPNEVTVSLNKLESVRKLAELLGPEILSLYNKLCGKYSGTVSSATNFEQLPISKSFNVR